MRIKAAGLAVVMALCLAVSIGTASASASGFSAFNLGTGGEEYPSTISGSLMSGTGSNIGWGGWGSAVCSPGTMSGHLEGPAKKIALEPNCGSQIQFNGCQLTVNAGAETAPGTFAATLDIGGASCSGISIKTEGTTLKCYGTIPPQSGITGSSLKDVEGSPDVVELSLNAALKGTGGGGDTGCPKTGEETSANWRGTWILSAKGSSGVARDLKALGYITSGVGFEEGQFVGGRYPMTASGDQTGSGLEFQAAAGFSGIRCSKAHFSGTLTSAAPSLTVGAEYSGCIDSFGRAVTVALHSCSYVFNGSGALGVSCTTLGDSIEYQIKDISGATLCTDTVPAQSGSTGLSYSMTGAGYAATVQVTAAVNTLTNTTSGGLFNCGTKNGTHTGGTLTGGVKLFGTAEYS